MRHQCRGIEGERGKGGGVKGGEEGRSGPPCGKRGTAGAGQKQSHAEKVGAWCSIIWHLLVDLRIPSR